MILGDEHNMTGSPFQGGKEGTPFFPSIVRHRGSTKLKHINYGCQKYATSFVRGCKCRGIESTLKSWKCGMTGQAVYESYLGPHLETSVAL